jgi:hypothetical protein
MAFSALRQPGRHLVHRACTLLQPARGCASTELSQQSYAAVQLQATRGLRLFDVRLLTRLLCSAQRRGVQALVKLRLRLACSRSSARRRQRSAGVPFRWSIAVADVHLLSYEAKRWRHYEPRYWGWSG